MDEGRPDNFTPYPKNRRQKDHENLSKRLQRDSEQVIQCPNCKQSFTQKVLQNELIRDWGLTESSRIRQSLSSRKSKGLSSLVTGKSPRKSQTPNSRDAKSGVRSDHHDSGRWIPQFGEDKLIPPSPESRVLALVIPESNEIVERYKLLMFQWHQTVLTRFDREPSSSKSPAKPRNMIEYMAKQGFGSWSQQDQFGNITKSTFVDHKPHGLVIEDNGSTIEVYYSIMGKRNGPYLCKFASGMVSYGCYCEDQRFGLWGFVHPDESFEQVNHGYEVLQSKID